MDYGHPLRFGLALTDHAAVARARLAEDLGLDVVAVTDPRTGEAGPEAAEPLDPWTLLAWVAGTTERIELAAHLIEHPDRSAAVFARAAASLDLLSGGRLETGLAARHAPALAEAVEVVRALWDTGEPGPAHVDGEYHALRGAQRGPAPAHEVALWLGADHADADDDALLELVAEHADGWWSATSRPDELAARNAAIDVAARAAGRDPREVRRLVVLTAPDTVAERVDAEPVGSEPVASEPVDTESVDPVAIERIDADAWRHELVALALEHGVSTFLLDTDDDDLVRVFAQRVVPAVREAVASARAAAGVVVGVPAPRRLREQRREGIDYGAVPAGLDAIEPGHARYGDVRSNYLRGGRPGIVLLPRDSGEVAAALGFARAQDVPLGVRSGGHGISGRSTNDGGVVIDLSRLDDVEILDPASRLVRVGAGARWARVAAVLEPHGLAVTSGDSGGVGVGGLATAGGIGWYARKHGLTIDRVRAVDLVLADGTAVRASASENPELFWGMRGAGGNLGVATSFEIEAHPAQPLCFAQLVFDASDVAGFLERWGAVVETSPRDVTSFLVMGRPRAGQPVVAQVMVAVDSSDPRTVIEHLNPFAQVAPLLDQAVQIMPYRSIIVPAGGPHRGEGEPVSRSSLVRHMSPEVAAAAERVIMTGATFFFQVRSVGGAVSDVPPDETAYAHRAAGFSLTAMGVSRGSLDPRWDELHQHADGLYLSFETDPRPERLLDAFPPPTLARLRGLKDHYDPDDVFSANFAVGSARTGHLA